jgi:dihydrofolate reductase
MGKLIYSAVTSLDGYVADESGSFDWAAPDEELHASVNELERPVSSYLYGRRMYDVMVAWEGEEMDASQSPAVRDYARIWRAAEKIVYSKTLAAVASAKTRIERDFDPDEVRRLKDAAQRDVSIGGPELAALALKAGLVDEVQAFVTPIIVGGGNPFLPGHLRLRLDLLDERRFGSGVVYLSYRVSV